MQEALPIARHRDRIIELVNNHQVVIIKAETGAGKSTQVPQFLLECAPKVLVTQPRRLAATSVAKRIAEEMGCELGTTVGYHTSMDYKANEDTRLLLCTDGLELVSQLLGGTTREGVLVIDEVHEWNLNIEMLVGWSKYQLDRGSPHKLVIMSATIEHELLGPYFGDAAVLEVSGRTFPVTERQPHSPMLDETLTLLQENHNVLVFQPGRAEIRRMISRLKSSSVDAEIFALHAEMPLDEQMLCFESYNRPKCIVATNVAQTSITIPDIDAVVDSGLERRVEYVDGIEGLYIRPISLMDREQRKGRAGRTKPGIYLDMCPMDLKVKRRIFPQSEINRLPVDKVILQLASVGVEVEEVKFFHKPRPEHIAQGRETLYRLGCADRFGTLTPVGKRAAPLPVTTRYARMLVEADKRDVLADVITLVSIMEQGGITNGKSEEWRKTVDISSWSDAFLQLAAYEAALKVPSSERENVGIDARAFVEARDMRQRLYISLQHTMKVRRRSRGRRKDIVACLYTGLIDHMYKRSLAEEGYKDKAGKYRDLPEGSVVADAEWVVGLPWSLQIKTGFGPKTLRLINMATRVNPVLLAETIPHLVNTEEVEDPEDRAGHRPRKVRTYVNGSLLAEEITLPVSVDEGG